MTGKVRLQDDVFSKGLATIIALTRCGEFTVELADKIRQKGGAERAVQAMKNEFFHNSTLNDIVWVGEVSVDYGTRPTYQDLNGSWFDWANGRFSDMKPELRGSVAKPVPTSGVIKRRFGYVHLNRGATDEQALAAIAKRGVIPVSDLELMYFGMTFPEEQRNFPIVALRSFFLNGRHWYSAVLCGDGGRRSLDLSFGTAVLPWDGGCRFLVREDAE